MLHVDVGVLDGEELLAVVVKEDDHCIRKNALWPRLEEHDARGECLHYQCKCCCVEADGEEMWR